MRQFQWHAMAPRTGLGLGLGRRARLARAAFAVVAVGAAVASILVAPGTIGFCGASLALVTCAIALHDARHFLIPNWLSVAALALAIGHAAALDPHAPLYPIGIALVRAGVAGGLFLALKLGYGWWRGHEGIGMGDVKLAAVAGAWLDWFALVAAIEIAVVAALGAYLVRHYVGKRPMRATHALPFGLYLAPAIWVGWFLQATVLAP
jgi:leader peptidase (prepilin peptidase)/N-methyltransferase